MLLLLLAVGAAATVAALGWHPAALLLLLLFLLLFSVLWTRSTPTSSACKNTAKTTGIPTILSSYHPVT